MIKGLPEKLKECRLKYGYSQKQVSEKIGVSPSIVSSYETGERTPSTDVLLALSRLYNVSTDHLLGRQTPAPELCISLDGLTEKQIAAIVNLVDVLKKQ